MCIKLAPGAQEKLSDPAFILRGIIAVEEESLERDKRQLEAEHRTSMEEMAKLPALLQPMNAPYWKRRFDEISTREKVLKERKARLQELEGGQK